MDNSLQALRLMQYGQGFGGVLRGMYRQIIPMQNKQIKPAPKASDHEPEQIGEGKRKRKRVYKASSQPPKKKPKKGTRNKKSSLKTKIKKFQVPIPPYNF